MNVSAETFSGLDEKEATRLADYLKYNKLNDTIEYISFCSWMAIHECCHIGDGDIVENLYATSLIDDTSCDSETGLRLFGFNDIEPVQTIESLCGASHYKFNAQSKKYERFEPGFPENHPSIEEQVGRFFENNPTCKTQLTEMIQAEKNQFMQNNLNMN